MQDVCVDFPLASVNIVSYISFVAQVTKLKKLKTQPSNTKHVFANQLIKFEQSGEKIVVKLISK